MNIKRIGVFALSIIVLAMGLCGCGKSQPTAISKEFKTESNGEENEILENNITIENGLAIESNTSAEDDTDIEIVDASYDGLEDLGYKFSFTAKNCTDTVIEDVALSINILNKKGDIIETIYQTGYSRLQPGQSIVIADWCDETDAYSAVVDSYDYYYNDEYYEGYIDDSPVVRFSYDDALKINDNSLLTSDDSGDVETTQFTTNGYTYSVPSSWELNSESDYLTSFYIDGSETSIVVVWAQEIPDIMKIDIGDGSAVLTKEDVPEHFMLDSYKISSEEWKSDLGVDYYEAFFSESDDMLGRVIVIPINETDGAFSVTVVSYDEAYLDDIDICVSSVEFPAMVSNKESETEMWYNLCMTLTKDDCTKDALGLYSYNGITFTSEDSEHLDAFWNEDGSINARSFYMSLQSALENFSSGNSWESYAEHVMGYTPSSREEFAPYVDEYLSYMTDAWFGNSMVEKFQTLDSVDVSENDATYICTITDVTQCAEELNISEEMLGYIMGALHDCGASISFDGNECIVEYQDYRSTSEDD